MHHLDEMRVRCFMPSSRDSSSVFPARLRALVSDQSGGIAIYAGILMVVVVGFAAMVLDIGHMMTVKSELQKASEAGALAGARAINNSATPDNFPDWTNGTNVGTATTQKNFVDQKLIANCSVTVGYWDLSWTSPPANLLPTGTHPTATQVPACKVTVSKASGKNSGPVTMWFAKIFGINTESLGASATAALIKQNPVGDVPPGSAFPIATPKYWADELYRTDRDSDSFRIVSDYHDSETEPGGQWTSFLIDSNNVPTIRELIDSGNPGPLEIGDQIWIEPGTKDTLFADAADRKGEVVLLPVVPDDFNTHDHTTLLAFIPFYIEDAKGGSGKYIQGHFVCPANVPPSLSNGSTGAPGAPNYGIQGYNAKLVN